MLLSKCSLVLAVVSSSLAGRAPPEDDYLSLAAQMIEANIQRGQGLATTSKVSTYIELGVFQQALRAAIATTKDASQAHRWAGYLHTSTYAPIANLTNSTKDALLPLDRFSTGTSLILSYRANPDPVVDDAVTALQDSLISQPRNENSGFWYFANPANPISYRNLSYLDGMYSYPKFASLLDAPSLADDILAQFATLYHATVQPRTGLLAHGYDAIKAHAWADPVTGASPVVWGRALAWYTAGILHTLETHDLPAALADKLRALFVKVVEPQIRTFEEGKKRTAAAAAGGHRVGVWQVVDRVGDEGNFVEASASFLTAWALLAGHRIGAFDGKPKVGKRAVEAGKEIYQGAKGLFLVRDQDGSVGINGTSSVASLGMGATINYEYYTMRPTELNSLFGTSGFILASLEMAKLAG